MHAVRVDLLARQADAAGLPIWPVRIPEPCSNEQYERAMGEVMERAREHRIAAVAFGDLFLEEVRAYREKQLARCGIEPLFPLWGRPTKELARTMLDAGLRADAHLRRFAAVSAPLRRARVRREAPRRAAHVRRPVRRARRVHTFAGPDRCSAVRSAVRTGERRDQGRFRLSSTCSRTRRPCRVRRAASRTRTRADDAKRAKKSPAKRARAAKSGAPLRFDAVVERGHKGICAFVLPFAPGARVAPRGRWFVAGRSPGCASKAKSGCAGPLTSCASTTYRCARSASPRAIRPRIAIEAALRRTEAQKCRRLPGSPGLGGRVRALRR